jgi:hypothetical protein
MDLSSGEWRQIEARYPARFHVSETTGAITVSARAMYLAEGDDGKFTRVAWNLPGGLTAGWLDSATEGWGLGWSAVNANTVVAVIARKAAPRGARSWVEVAKTPAGCPFVLRDPNGVPQWCATALGSLYRRDDAEWTLEYLAD